MIPQANTYHPFSSPTTSLRHYSKRLKYTNSTACYKEQFSHHYGFRDLKGEQIILRNQWQCAPGTAIRGCFLQDHQFQQQHLKATHPNSHTYRKQVTSFYTTMKAHNRATTKMDRNWPSISNLRKKEQNKRVVDKTNPTCSEQNLHRVGLIYFFFHPISLVQKVQMQQKNSPPVFFYSFLQSKPLSWNSHWSTRNLKPWFCTLLRWQQFLETPI